MYLQKIVNKQAILFAKGLESPAAVCEWVIAVYSRQWHGSR